MVCIACNNPLHPQEKMWYIMVHRVYALSKCSMWFSAHKKKKRKAELRIQK